MADKTILQLTNKTPVTTDTSVFSDTAGTFGYTFVQLLALIQSNISAGAIVTFGTSIPANTVGNNGDVYVQTALGQFAQKLSGAWTVVYTIPIAADGTVLFGTGVPSSSTGKNGDTYIDEATGIFYQRPSGTWAQVYSIATGPQGPRGNSILNGSGAPTTQGTNGDYYIDNDAEVLYGPKSGGVWPGSGLSLIPAVPNTILTGTASPINSQGNNGDYFINSASWYIYGPKSSGVWGDGTSLIGPSPIPVTPIITDITAGVTPISLTVPYTSMTNPTVIFRDDSGNNYTGYVGYQDTGTSIVLTSPDDGTGHSADTYTVIIKP